MEPWRPGFPVQTISGEHKHSLQEKRQFFHHFNTIQVSATLGFAEIKSWFHRNLQFTYQKGRFFPHFNPQKLSVTLGFSETLTLTPSQKHRFRHYFYPQQLPATLGFPETPTLTSSQKRPFHHRFNPQLLPATLGFADTLTLSSKKYRLPQYSPQQLSESLGFAGTLTLTSSQKRQFCHCFNPQELSATLGFTETLTLTPSVSFQNSKDADMVSRILIEHHNPYHTMEATLQLDGIRVTPHLVHQVLLRLKNLSKIAFGFFVWAKQHTNYRHDVSAYNLMIDILGKVCQFDAAWQLIIEMDQSNLKPTEKTFAILIRRYIASGMTRQAIRTFDDMESFIGREPNSSDFCVLLDTLCKYGFVKVATEIFNKRKGRFPPDTKMYSVLIYGWSKFNRPVMAEKFFNEMIDRGFEPNVVTYNILLNGICRQSSLDLERRFEQTIEAAEKVMEQMDSRGIEPDSTSYSIILHVYSRAHKPNLLLVKLRTMEQKGICPTIATYTSVIKCLCSCGRMENAEELLDEMIKNGVHPTAVTYNCFFKEYRGRKDSENAWKLYRKMKESSSLSAPTIHTYNILVGMFSRLDRAEVVDEVWNDMKESGCSPDLDSYTLLVHGLCEKRKWREACQFFVEMIEKGFLPQKVTFETLYRGLIQSDMLRTWRRLKKRLEEESVKFNSEYPHYHFKPYRR